MALLRWVFLSAIGIVLIFIAVANRETVVLRLLPDEIAAVFPVPGPVSLPLFLVIFAGIVLGLLIGFVWEWMRERRHRLEAAAKRREVAKLEREVDGLKREKSGSEDDILALLD